MKGTKDYSRGGSWGKAFLTSLLLPLLLVLLMCECSDAVPSGRRRGGQRNVPVLTCPPEVELGPCVCRLRSAKIHIMCEGSDEARVMEALEALMRRTQPVEELHLLGNQIPELPARAFGSLLINKLFLANNEMISIDRNAFAGLESSLRHLHVEEPTLHTLPFDTLDHLVNLRTCVIENTAIASLPRLYSLSRLEFLKIDGSGVDGIPSAAFRFMPNMKKVHVANSRLKEVASNALEGLVYLREVNLSHNAIQWVHPRAFRTLTTVEQLVLADNKISDATATVLATRELRQLQQLDLSKNLIRRLSKATFVDMKTVNDINLSDNIISRIDVGTFYKLPSLKRLDLSGNLLQEFRADVFDEPLNLEHLNLARNNLTYMAGLATLARALPTLVSLDLSDNQLQVATGALQGHPHLQALRLDHNNIEKLPPATFQNLPSLRELHLSHNLITSDLQEAAWDLPELRTLDMSHNELQGMDAILLEGLPRLSKLDLSFNVIEVIGDGALIGTPHIKNLNMSYNSLIKLPEGVFSTLDQLLEVELSFNELVALESGVFQDLPRLRRLYLSHNQITTVSPFTFTNTSNLQHFDLSANLLQDIPPGFLTNMALLKHLKLNHNAFSRAHNHYFRGLQSLYHLDFSHNHIQGLDDISFHDLNSLKDLDLSVNYLENLQSDMFTGSGGVERLNASHNYLRALGGFTTDIPRLRVLDLTNNSLTELGDEVRGLNMLQGLFLANNYFTKLENTTLEGLERLNVLRLENNGIQTFQTGTFSGLNALLTLDLTNNNLVELQPDSLAALPVLEEVRLGRNQIAIIKDFAITNLPELRSLELQDNMISEVGAHGFHELPVLQFLNLSRNGFQEVPEDALARLPSLQVLDLSWNYILQIKDSTFYPLEALTVLMLHDNDLCRMSSGSFQRQSSLRVLTLNNNQLRRLHLHALGSALAHLVLLDMSGNPFHCDCELVWLREYLMEDPDRDRGPRYPALHLQSSLRGVPVCAAPPQYQGLPITKVPSSAFLCDERRMKKDENELDKEDICHSRYINPVLFSGDHTGSFDDLLLSNYSDITGDGAVDYTNPILVPGIKPPTTPTTTTTAKPATAAVQVANTAVPITTTKVQQKQEQQASQPLHTVTGDTPTIYAGSSDTSTLSSRPASGGGNEEITGGLLGNLRLPSFPNLLELAGMAIPHIGLNVNWGVPGLGRSGTHTAPTDDKPMKGPDGNSPVWVDGPVSPHPHFVAPPPQPTGGPARGPAPAPSINSGAPNDNVNSGPPFPFPPGPGEPLNPGVPGKVIPVTRPPNVWAARPQPDQPRPAGRPVLPPVLHSGPGPSSGAYFLPGSPAPLLPNHLQPPQHNPHHPHPDNTQHPPPPHQQPNTHPGHPPPLPDTQQPPPHQQHPNIHPHQHPHPHPPPQQGHPNTHHGPNPHPHPEHTNTQHIPHPHPHPNPNQHHQMQSPSVPGQIQVQATAQTPQHTVLATGSAPEQVQGQARLPAGFSATGGENAPKWSHPETIHPDSGVSHYQPGEPFLPYNPNHHRNPITVIKPPQMTGQQTSSQPSHSVQHFSPSTQPHPQPSHSDQHFSPSSQPHPQPSHSDQHFSPSSQPHPQPSHSDQHFSPSSQPHPHPSPSSHPHPHPSHSSHPDMSPSETQVMLGGGDLVFAEVAPPSAPSTGLAPSPLTTITATQQNTDHSIPQHLPTPSGPPPISTHTAALPDILPSSPQSPSSTHYLPTALPSPITITHEIQAGEKVGTEEEELAEEETGETGIQPTLSDLVGLLFAAEEEVKEDHKGTEEENWEREGMAEEETKQQDEWQNPEDEITSGNEQETDELVNWENEGIFIHDPGNEEENGHGIEGGTVEEKQDDIDNEPVVFIPLPTPTSISTTSSVPEPEPQPSSTTTTTTTSTTTTTTTTDTHHAIQGPTQRSTTVPSNLEDMFPAKLGEGVRILQDTPPNPIPLPSAPTLNPDGASGSDSIVGTMFPDSIIRKPGRPGMITAVDKDGAPLNNFTYISPSRSKGRGGYPTIERVFQPGQQGHAAHSLSEPEVEAEGGSHGHTQPTPTQELTLPPHPPSEADFEETNVNGVDWYYNNYHRDHASLPVGGNEPPTTALAPSPKPTTNLVLTLVFFTLCFRL